MKQFLPSKIIHFTLKSIVAYLYLQIRLLCKADPEEKVPEFYDIFKDDDDDDDDVSSNVRTDLQF